MQTEHTMNDGLDAITIHQLSQNIESCQSIAAALTRFGVDFTMRGIVAVPDLTGIAGMDADVQIYAFAAIQASGFPLHRLRESALRTAFAKLIDLADGDYLTVFPERTTTVCHELVNGESATWTESDIWKQVTSVHLFLTDLPAWFRKNENHTSGTIGMRVPLHRAAELLALSGVNAGDPVPAGDADMQTIAAWLFANTDADASTWAGLYLRLTAPWRALLIRPLGNSALQLLCLNALRAEQQPVAASS
jgi:hypothetical protein